MTNGHPYRFYNSIYVNTHLSNDWLGLEQQQNNPLSPFLSIFTIYLYLCMHVFFVYCIYTYIHICKPPSFSLHTPATFVVLYNHPKTDANLVAGWACLPAFKRSRAEGRSVSRLINYMRLYVLALINISRANVSCLLFCIFLYCICYSSDCSFEYRNKEFITHRYFLYCIIDFLKLKKNYYTIFAWKYIIAIGRIYYCERIILVYEILNIQ